MEWPCPKLEVGGVVMLMQSFSWTMTPGPQPFITSLRVPTGELDAALRAVKNPTYIQITAYGGTRGEPERTTIRIDNVYLLEPKNIDPYHVMWQIADARWGWRGRKLFYSYNKTRKMNAKGIATTDEITPAALRRPFDTFTVGRYLHWSMKEMGEAVWNMKEITEDQLKRQGIPYDPNAANNDGAYTLENVEGNGLDIYQGLASLLSAGRNQIGIKPSGEVYVYSIDYFDDSQINLIAQWQEHARTKPGIIYQGDKKRIRPRKINVKFEQMQEVRVVAVDGVKFTGIPSGPNSSLSPAPNPPLWDQIDIDSWRVIGCQNVMQCPYPVFSAYQQKEINIGEYIPMWEFLDSLNPAIAEADIRNRWFGENLERWYGNKLDAGNPNKPNEQLIQNIIGAIKRSYRQIYQISPYHMDRIRFWQPQRCAIIDNYSHYSPPSPLFANYCVIPSRRHPSLAKRIALWDESAYNWEPNTKDPYRRQATAGKITVVDQDLGIFAVSYPPLVDTFLKAIIPSSLDPLPGISIASTLLEACYLSSTHVLDTIISAVWDVVEDEEFSSDRKFFVVSFDYANKGGEGPEIDYFSTLDYARMPAREFDEEGTTVTNPWEPVNRGVLEAVAQAEAGKVMNQFLDRYCGLVTLAGYVPVSLTGNMKGVTFHFTPQAGMETTIDLRDVPPDPTVEQQVPARVLSYLKRQVTRADYRNEVAP